ncbi:hypothetical protein BKA65DRAFT_105022 [Rhexocercosporidium sp. MPI-PUGE-AT-0058]|nr:hypothetical protein BKA65DRAFT_105022 [Rhexocercosporidium sp. MPI-PUGE-AT-0058]
MSESSLFGIVISLNDSLPTFTTSSRLSGYAAITAVQTARFDEAQITLEGCSRIIVEPTAPIAQTRGINAKHVFLKLAMPIDESEYPPSHIAEPGKTYNFAFNFVIPERLPLSSCSHRCAGPHVQQAHLHLPPSMGDGGFTPLYPTKFTRKIEYAIYAKVLQFRGADYKAGIVASDSKELRFIPATSEEPPIYIQPSDSDYSFIRTKNMKKGRFKGKLGEFTLSAEQPMPFQVSPISSTPATITVTLKVRFDPLDPSYEPPRVGKLTTKIKISTVFATRAFPDLPKRCPIGTAYDQERCGSLVIFPLLTMSINFSSLWAPYHSSDSGIEPAPPYPDETPQNIHLTQSTSQPGRGSHNAKILVPITLPSSKQWLPTFHCCLVSRFYTLEFSLAVQSPGNRGFSTWVLRLPVQVSSSILSRTVEVATGSAGEGGSIQSSPMSERPSEAFFRSRTLPGQADEEPPGYELIV